MSVLLNFFFFIWDIPASLLAADLSEIQPAQQVGAHLFHIWPILCLPPPENQIAASKEPGKENITLSKKEFKKPATRKRKLPLQELGDSRPQKRAKIEKSEIPAAGPDPFLSDLKEDIKRVLSKPELFLHLSTEDTKDELPIDPELPFSLEEMKPDPSKNVTPIKAEQQPVKTEQPSSEVVHPFDIQHGIEISKITEESRLFLGNADIANNSDWYVHPLSYTFTEVF